MKKAVAWFAENHVAANLLMIFLLLAGAYTALNMKIEVFPETELDIITITTEYSGASPAEVEEAILRRIEERVAGLAGIDRIDSNARESFGTVTIEVMKDWDVKKLLDEVKSEVDRITTLPDEAEKPEVRSLTRRSRVINVAVFGDARESTIKHLAEKIKDDITNLPGITLAEVQGVREREVSIEISEETLRRYGLTLGQVAEVVRKGSLDLPAGRIKTSGGEILIRTKGRRYHADDYRDVAVITYADGRKVTLGQIAELKDSFEDTDLQARFQIKDKGLKGMVQTLKYYPWTILTEYNIQENPDEVILSVPSCPTQKARLKRGLDEFVCKDAHQGAFVSMAKEVDERIRVKCFFAPPDPHPDDMFCKWRFYLEDNST